MTLADEVATPFELPAMVPIEMGKQLLRACDESWTVKMSSLLNNNR